MQVSGMKTGALGVRYTGALDALQGVIRTEGVRGLYRGLWPNLCKYRIRSCRVQTLTLMLMLPPVKVAPSIATSFFVYELVKDFLVPP